MDFENTEIGDFKATKFSGIFFHLYSGSRGKSITFYELEI